MSCLSSCFVQVPAEGHLVWPLSFSEGQRRAGLYLWQIISKHGEACVGVGVKNQCEASDFICPVIPG